MFHLKVSGLELIHVTFDGSMYYLSFFQIQTEVANLANYLIFLSN